MVHLKKKLTHITLLLLTLSIVLNLLLPTALVLADKKEDLSIDIEKLEEEKNTAKEKPDKTDKEKQADREKVQEALKEDDRGVQPDSTIIWTAYAQFIMSSAKQKDKDSKESEKKQKENQGMVEKAFDGAISGIIGDGGVSLDIPYNKMYSLANSLNGGKEDKTGTQLASFLSTHSYYSYIDTISGNRVAAETSNGLVSIVKLFAGAIIMTSLALYYIIDGILSLVVKGFIAINPFALLGFGNEEVLLKNPIANAINSMLISIGLDSAFFTSLTEFGLIFVVGIFGFKMMKYMSDKHLEGIWKTLQKFGVQIFTMFAMIPLLMLIYAEVGKGIATVKNETSLDSDLASQHILNVRGWASTQNLAPKGLYLGEFPDASYKTGHIDKKFAPTSSRQMIADINEETYTKLYGSNTSAKGFQLVTNWMSNSNFNVNTYFGDIQRKSEGTGEDNLPAYAQLTDFYPKIKNKEIEYVMWSGTQNVNEKLRDVKNKQFKPDKPIGVYNSNTFSTQSVALMLQSSFDDGGAHFYAYNLAPKGLQGNMKNLSTVKTEWKSYTMPGEGPLGVFASGLSLTAKSLGYAMLGIACVVSLLTINLFETFGRFLKCIAKAVGFGKFNQATSSFFLAISVLISSLIAFMLPQLFVNFITEMVGAINKVSQKAIPSGLLDMIGGIITLYLCYYIGYGAKVGGKKISPIKAFIGLPNEMALAYADKMDMMTGDDIKQGMKQGYKGASQRARMTSRDLNKSASNTVQDSKRRLKGASKGAVLTGAKEAALGFTAGGVGGAVAGGVKGASKGAYKGAKGENVKMGSLRTKKPNVSAKENTLKNRNNPDVSAKENTLENRNNPKEIELDSNLNRLYPEEKAYLGDSKDVNDFSDRLRETKGGEAISLNTESSSNALQGTTFVDNDGNVSESKIERFRKEYKEAVENDKVTPEMEKQRNQLEHAYRVGAEEIYDRKGASYFADLDKQHNVDNEGYTDSRNQTNDFVTRHAINERDTSSSSDAGNKVYTDSRNQTNEFATRHANNVSEAPSSSDDIENNNSEAYRKYTERNNKNIPTYNESEDVNTEEADRQKASRENDEKSSGRLNQKNRLYENDPRVIARERRIQYHKEKEERIKVLKEIHKNRNNTPE